MAQVYPVSSPMMQVQIPPGVGPGQQFMANVNGMNLPIIAPPGSVPGQMLQVPAPQMQAPQMQMMQPQMQQMQPGMGQPAPVQINVQVVAAPQQQKMDRFGEALLIRQEWSALELCGGCEAPNRYRVYKASKDARSTDNLENTMYINEESDCCERICCGVNRSLTLVVRQGTKKDGPELLRLKKPFHLQGCCCCRPEMDITDSAGNQVGHIDDPCACCVMNQTVKDHTGEVKYKVEGTLCQCGLCVPCIDIKFDVKDVKGGPPGEIRKIFDGCSEICLKTNKFKITFPENATEPDKSLLLGATMLLDLEYFEVQKRKE